MEAPEGGMWSLMSREAWSAAALVVTLVSVAVAARSYQKRLVSQAQEELAGLLDPTRPLCGLTHAHTHACAPGGARVCAQDFAALRQTVLGEAELDDSETSATAEFFRLQRRLGETLGEGPHTLPHTGGVSKPTHPHTLKIQIDPRPKECLSALLENLRKSHSILKQLRLDSTQAASQNSGKITREIQQLNLDLSECRRRREQKDKTENGISPSQQPTQEPTCERLDSLECLEHTDPGEEGCVDDAVCVDKPDSVDEAECVGCVDRVGCVDQEAGCVEPVHTEAEAAPSRKTSEEGNDEFAGINDFSKSNSELEAAVEQLLVAVLAELDSLFMDLLDKIKTDRFHGNQCMSMCCSEMLKQDGLQLLDALKQDRVAAETCQKIIEIAVPRIWAS